MKCPVCGFADSKVIDSRHVEEGNSIRRRRECLACQKRPVNAEDIALEIESELQNSLRNEITTNEIGEIVMNKLKQKDEVAYVRFASVYREFKDIETFLTELSRLKGNS